MEAALRIIGDGLSIAALAIIASTAQMAWKRIPKDARIPMQWGADGKPTWRTSKTVGLLAVPVLAIVILLSFTLTQLTFTVEGPGAVIVLCVRAILAAALALSQLVHLRKVMETLGDGGEL
jgi:uncharacterized membrane protein